MNTLIHADIFFFITTIGVIILIVLAIVAAIYVISILGTVRRISIKLERNVEKVTDEAKELFADIQESLVYKLLFRKKRTHSK